jgi:hypothetical protein
MMLSSKVIKIILKQKSNHKGKKLIYDTAAWLKVTSGELLFF